MASKPKKKKRCQGKGSQFERDIARTLSKWWTKGNVMMFSGGLLCLAVWQQLELKRVKAR